MEIGFIGLGQMGAGMAGRLADAQHSLIVFNRTRERMDPFAARARLAGSWADFAATDVVFTMLADDQAVRAAVLAEDALLTHLRPGAIHVSCSTISPALSAQLAEHHARAGQGYLAVPVFGRPDAASAGTLFLVAGGPPDLIARVQPLLDVLGARTFVVSQRPEQAHLVKLSGNFLIATVIEALGEAMALVEKGGLGRHGVLEILTASLFNVPLYKNYGALIADERFTPPGFAARLGQKDIRLVLGAAESLGVPLPLASLLRDRFLALIASGRGDVDWSAVASLARRDAGL